MLQVDTDAPLLFLAADSSAAPPEKIFSSSSISVSYSSSVSSESSLMSASNQWQPPAWHPHHSRHVPPPSTAAAHLPAPFALPSPRMIMGHLSRSIDSSPATNHHQHTDEQRYGAAGYSTSSDFAHTGYAQNSYQDQQRDTYYASDSQWSYPAESHAHHHHHSHTHGGVYGGKPASDSMGLAIDPLPLRQLVLPPTSSNVNGGGAVEDDLYEAHMLQEALTTQDYSRAHLGGFHHPHQLPPHPQSQQMQPSQYSSPFVSAVLDASAPMHTHATHNGSVLGGLHMARPGSSTSLAPSESAAPSDSDVTSGSIKSTTAAKRKRRGESAPRLCRVEGCSKGIRSRGLCKAHGGGRRCMTPGCTTSDQGGGHCVLHGGGRRCTVEGCTKSAQWKGLCKMHGGARRCRYPNCTKNGQVKAGYCRAHHNLISKQREQGIVEA